MKVYHNIDEFRAVSNPAFTTGTFDGVHLGHQKIIDSLNEIARRTKGESVLLTFDPHPRMILNPEDNGLRLLNTLSEKIKLLKRAGIQHLIIQPFTKDFASLSSTTFIQQIIVEKIRAKTLVIGYNHRFGNNREGSFEHLRKYAPKYGFEVAEISAKDLDNVEVSSTSIRQALGTGDVETAEKYLGYSYLTQGQVIPGDKRGRTIGFPTANIKLDDALKLVPADGVYAVRVQLGQDFFNGMLNIGNRPTFENAGKSIEVNIFEFDKDIYGETLRVFFVARLRNEQKFENIAALKTQLKKDKENSLIKLAVLTGNLL